MTHKKILTCATVLGAILVAAPTPAQDDLLVKPCGGAIGKTIQLDILKGNASEKCLLVTSFTRASIPLSVFDGKDPRTIRVALDIPLLHFFLTLNAQGELKLAFLIPNDNGLVGLSSLHQAITYPGKTTLANEV